MTAPTRLSPAEAKAWKRWDPERRHAPLEPLEIDDLLGRLEAVRRNGSGRWMARCPAHGDKGPSLSIRRGDDDRILLHCFSGCDFTAIVEALGIEQAQLFPSPLPAGAPRRVRIDPRAEAKALADRLGRTLLPPHPARMRTELVCLGRLFLGGTKALAALPDNFRAEDFRTLPLRLIYLAMEEVAGGEKQWRRFSAQSLWRAVERLDGRRLRVELFFWLKAAVSAARWEA
jgi:hypothetical protein